MKTTRATHTPGPWEAAHPGNYDADGIAVYARNKAGLRYTIAAVRYLGTADPAPAEANARLIAAAPALLKACEAIITDLERFVSRQGPGPDARLAALKAAIAQAEGGE